MTFRNELGRRQFFLLSGGLATSAPHLFDRPKQKSNISTAVPQEDQMERFFLDLGHRATRSGPVASLTDGSLLWITTEPEPPYISKAMWSISRLAMRRSQDGGKSWGGSEILQQGTKDYSLLSHTLRQSSTGKIIHIFVRYSGYDYETGTPEKSLCKVYIQHSNDQGKTWSEAQALPTGERYHGDILSIEQLPGGRWVYPFCFLTNIKSQFAVSAMYSDDDGTTWSRSSSVLTTGGAGFESGASEPTVIALKDQTLWMLIRAQTGYLWESFSGDSGQTWSSAKPSSLPSSNAPATALKLRNGDIAIVWNNHVDSNYARQSLVIGLTNDGKTFKGLREIDFTDFTDDPAIPVQHVTYAYLTETEQGTIIVSYNKGNWSHHNRPMLARISPTWIGANREIVNFKNGRTGWHIINPGPNFSHAVERFVSPDEESLWLEIEQHATNKQPTGIIRSIPLLQEGTIQLTVQVMKPEAFILFGASLLSPRNPNEGSIRIRFSTEGTFIAIGKENREQNNRKATEYIFTSYQITDEIPYPYSPGAKDVLNISVAYQSIKNNVEIKINHGKPISLKTEKIFGLCYLGLLVANGGQIRMHSIEINSINK
ncbi:MAG: exo-alpha-sialidase [Saprospiraceae bacterium]|nr:exo-alpha-sialidase [Saprospiraceae bacterium]